MRSRGRQRRAARLLVGIFGKVSHGTERPDVGWHAEGLTMVKTDNVSALHLIMGEVYAPLSDQKQLPSSHPVRPGGCDTRMTLV